MTSPMTLRPPITPILDALRAAQLERGGKPLGVADRLVVDRAERVDGFGGWIPATHFIEGPGIPQLLAGPAQSWDAAPHATVALAWKAYSYWLSLPAVVG
nr:hypothetical protein [Longispora sp. (in: high G+C Gram-positive bacteria)]